MLDQSSSSILHLFISVGVKDWSQNALCIPALELELMSTSKACPKELLPLLNKA
jgi:hypothetical protein